MNNTLRNLVLACGLAVAGAASADVVLYQHDGFRGQTMTVDHQAWNLDRRGFNDEVSSVVIRSGTWQLCEDARFEGRCVTLGPGRYPSLGRMGLNDKLSSLRPVEQHYGREGRYEDRAAYDREHNREYRDNQYNNHDRY